MSWASAGSLSLASLGWIRAEILGPDLKAQLLTGQAWNYAEETARWISPAHTEHIQHQIRLKFGHVAMYLYRDTICIVLNSSNVHVLLRYIPDQWMHCEFLICSASSCSWHVVAYIPSYEP